MMSSLSRSPSRSLSRSVAARFQALALALLALAGLSPAAGIDDARSLWAGFDPRRDPLEIEVVRAWNEESFRLEELYFTGETWEGEKARVFAYRGVPAGPAPAAGGGGERVPGVLHIHGGGQTASVEWVKYWCRRGYACVSFDFCGKHPTRAGPHTLWGRVKGDMMTVGGGRILAPDARHCPWFHWALAARRALTLLEDHPRVDGGRLGIFGISVGGTLTWIVAGTDDRVKAAVPIYGCGWDSYPKPWEDPSELPGDELALWRRALAAETYAPLVRCPVFFLSSTNDHHGLMDRSFRTLDLSPAAEKRASFTPQYIHHIDREEARGLALWMDWHLKGGPPWPAEPRIELVAGAAVPEVRVIPADAGEVESVTVHYALSNPWPQSRHWRRAPTAARGHEHRAEVPYFTKDDTIHVFAAVKYRSGAKPSSRLVSREARFLHGTEPTLRAEALIDPMTEIGSWYYGPAYTDPWREDRYFEPWEGPAGERGFSLAPALFADPMTFEIATHQLGDPQYRRKGRGALLVDALDARRPERLEVKAIERQWQPGHTEFRGPARYGAARDGWVEIRVEPDGLEGPEGRKLPGWDAVDCLVLLGSAPRKSPPVFRRLRWEG